jgi:hypothetical protein
MSQTVYPYFSPPEFLASKIPRSWTRIEAKAYFDWLSDCMPNRITVLLKYFGIEDASALDPERLFTFLGEKVAENIASDAFSSLDSKGVRQLNDAGYALAADMGLLVAKYLIDVSGESVRWKIARGATRDLSFNLPVLVGFGRITLDPVGGSIAEAAGILAGRRSSDVWLRMFEFWKARIDEVP